TGPTNVIPPPSRHDALPILGLIHRDSGTVTVGGKPLARMRKEIAYVPQRGEVDWNFPITVEQTALLGTYPRLGILRRPNSAARRSEEHTSELQSVAISYAVF